MMSLPLPTPPFSCATFFFSSNIALLFVSKMSTMRDRPRISPDGIQSNNLRWSRPLPNRRATGANCLSAEINGLVDAGLWRHL